MFLPNLTTSFRAQLLQALGFDIPTVLAALKALTTATSQTKSKNADETAASIDSGVDVVSYRLPRGSEAFTTVGTDGQRFKNGEEGSDNNSEGNPELLKWSRTVTRADGSEAIAVNFAFGENFSAPGIDKGRAKTLIKKAFQTWAQHAPLDFQELKYSSKQPNSDIDILIEGANLDGPGKKLAEAFFPKVGGITFDTSETWTDAKFSEAGLHEIGHALGLDHEDETDAIMNSRIANRFTNPDKLYLLEDDIAGIQNLYGEGIGSVTTLGGKRHVIVPPTIPMDGATDGTTDDAIAPSGESNDGDPTSDNLNNTPPAAPELGPNLIKNGSFETIPLGEQEFGLYSKIVGWKVTDGIGFRIDKRTELVGDAAEGTAWAALDILGQNSTMAQNVDTLTGQAYELSVNYSNGGAEQSTAGIDMFWEGEKVDSLTGGGKGLWENFAFEVTGSDRNVGTLAFRATGPADNISGLIDNISIRAIQTPSLQANTLLEQDTVLGATSTQASTGLPSAETDPIMAFAPATNLLSETVLSKTVTLI